MYLLDTNILSELVRKSPSPRLLEKLAQHPSSALFTSAICVMELRRGAAMRTDREAFWKRLQREILARVNVVAYGQEEAILAGDLYASQQLAGTLIGLPDLMIAATALTRRYTVVSANVRHFRRVPNLPVENWIEGP